MTGETPVLTDSGVRPIEDVVGDTDGFEESEDELRVATMTDRNDFEYVEPSHVFGKRAEELVEVTTRDGAEFRVTPEHKLRVITHEGFEWVPAEELSDGDRIARPNRLPTPTADSTTEPTLRWYDEMNPERTEVTLDTETADGLDLDRTVPLSTLRETVDGVDSWVNGVEAIEYVRQGRRSRSIIPPTDVTPELARFVGLAISEARIDGGRIKFYNTDDALLNAFESTAHAVFDVETRRGIQKDVPYVAIGSRTLTHYLESVFDAFASASGEKGIGSNLVTAGTDARAEFLRAMFDAEAHVSANGIIELTQRNPDHITLLSYLLTTFGISSRRKELKKSATNGCDVERTYHALYISGAQNLRRFRDAIGFTITHKSDRLDEHAGKKANPNYDTIPTQTVLRDLCRRLDIPITEHLPRASTRSLPEESATVQF
nr:LAGLIDADG family homing endonuclease [Halorubrum saccharovorum]